MKKLSYFFTLCSLITGFVFANVSLAQPIPAPTVEYSAIRQLVMSEGAFTQTVHHSHGKERNEMEIEGMGMVSILRPDKKVAWQLMPMQRMYMEVDLKSANEMNGSIPDDVTIEKVGSEDVEGIKTTKYKILMKDKSAGGFIWLSPDNIPIKMDFLSKEGKEKSRITMTLKNLKIEPQEAALFELPPGYQPMPKMGNMMQGFTPR